MTVRGMRTSDLSQQSQCPFRTCLGSFVTKLQSIIRWQDAKKRNIGSQQIDTSQPDSFILFSESINNNPGKNTRDNNWWKIDDCSLASDVWSVAIWSDQNIKHNALQIAVSHSMIMLLMELQNFILPLYCILFYILLEILCICIGQCLPMEGKVKWNETPHKSWSCCFSWRIITNMHCMCQHPVVSVIIINISIHMGPKDLSRKKEKRKMWLIRQFVPILET